MRLNVEYVPIDSVKPYEGNAKMHPKEQIEQIKKSMQEFGVKDPIGVWHNKIVEGHGRYEAAKQLGYSEIPVIRLDDLTDEQRKAYGLVHNQLTMNTPFDLDTLKLELDSIGDIDLTDMGFDLTLHDEYTDEPDLSELDDEGEKKNIVVTLNIKNVGTYESIKNALQNIIADKDINMAVKMS